MAISLAGFITSGPVGPGYFLVPRTSTFGPFPLDDVCIITVTKQSTGHQLCTGSGTSQGDNTISLILGTSGYPFNVQTVPGLYVEQATSGEAVDLLCQWEHASGALVDESTLSGFTWDPIGAAFAVQTDARNAGGFTAADRELLTQLAHTDVSGYPTTPGAIHPALSGTGYLAFSGSPVALKVQMTPQPAEWPQSPGTPAYFFSAGFVTSWSLGAPIKGWRLVYSDQTFPLSSRADAFSWTLPPGIVVLVTEMLRAA